MTLSADVIRRLRKIRLLISDVDGVMTDGKLFWHPSTGWNRAYHVRDGIGIFELRRAGIDTAIITAAVEDDVKARADRLKIQHFFVGSRDKLSAYEDLKRTVGLSDAEIAYIGDDLPDVPVFKQVGLAVSVPDAVSDVREIAHYVTKTSGGNGAVREIADFIRVHSEYSNARSAQ